jgi:cysteinyl-tRNA synthetase
MAVKKHELRIYNTATRSLQDFVALNPPEVRMYHCGPTVYNHAHIGNLRAYVFSDILRRTLEALDFEVKQVINITDIGHLSDDADNGEDKMTLALKREGKPLTREAMRELGDLYTRKFLEHTHLLNILPASLYPKASDHINEDIELIEALSKNGYTYVTADGVYFDTGKFPDYAKFAKLDIKGMEGGKRVDQGEKHHFTDFALWKFNQTLGYESPFGRGFPGWHVECSAMSRKYLGQPFDIHTGGIDHIPTHHTNEIAQSECAYKVPLANYWLHSAHVMVDGQKMSKSLGNVYYLTDLEERGISPLAYRYWLLTASYHKTVNFTWEAVEGSATYLKKLYESVYALGNESGTIDSLHFERFTEYIEDNLNTAGALSELAALLSDQTISPKDKRATIAEMDRILGLGLLSYRPKEVHMTEELGNLLNARKNARESQNWPESDRLRGEIRDLGYEVKDTSEGQVLSRI